MKNKKGEGFSAIYSAFCAEKLRERFLFRVRTSTFSPFMASISKTRLSRIIISGFMAWIFVAGQIAFAESFPDRPTISEMDEIVRLGTECVIGVNERCWATQYSTNPVQYRVAPFTNNTEFYLDQNLMAAMADKIRSLVPWYVKLDTVSNGSPNIASLTVTGVWDKLAIGDHTNKFTSKPASETTPATYADDPWRIYVTALQERFAVLYSLSMITAGSYTVTNEYLGTGLGISPGTWEQVKAYAAASFEGYPYPWATLTNHLLVAAVSEGDVLGGSGYSAYIFRSWGRYKPNIIQTNLAVKKVDLYLKGLLYNTHGDRYVVFDDYGDGISSNFSFYQTLTGEWFEIGSRSTPTNPWCDDPSTVPSGKTGRGYYTYIYAMLVEILFSYCTNKFW